MAYTDAYTSFGIALHRRARHPQQRRLARRGEGHRPGGLASSTRPHPHAVNARHVIGQMLPDTVFGCLHQILPGRVPGRGHLVAVEHLAAVLRPADGSPRGDGGRCCRSTPAAPVPDRRRTGCRPPRFPSGVRNMPVEINETITPIVFWRKELRPGSGGDGRFRGGHGQVVELGSLDDRAVHLPAPTSAPCTPPAAGRGADPGPAGPAVPRPAAAPCCSAMGRSEIPAGERLLHRVPRWWGLRRPRHSDPWQTQAERRAGLVT